MAKILLIEDDPLVVKMYRNVLSFEGFKMETAPNGEEGLKKAKTFKPDLIFLDVMMPKLNGIEVLDNIKKDPELKDTPVIMLTNLAGASNAEEALKKGAFAYMVKSEYKPKEVAEKAKEFFSKHPKGNQAMEGVVKPLNSQAAGSAAASQPARDLSEVPADQTMAQSKVAGQPASASMSDTSSKISKNTDTTVPDNPADNKMSPSGKMSTSEPPKSAPSMTKITDNKPPERLKESGGAVKAPPPPKPENVNDNPTPSQSPTTPTTGTSMTSNPATTTTSPSGNATPSKDMKSSVQSTPQSVSDQPMLEPSTDKTPAGTKSAPGTPSVKPTVANTTSPTGMSSSSAPSSPAPSTPQNEKS